MLAVIRICCFVLLLPLLGNAQTLPFKNFNVEDGLPSSEVYHCIQDSKGFMWFSTDRGVARYDGNEFEVFTTDNGLPDNVVFELYEDHAGKIWFVSYSNRLSYFDQGEIHTYKYNHILDSLPANKIKSSFHVDRKNMIHLGFANNGYITISDDGICTNVSVPGKVGGCYAISTLEGKPFGYMNTCEHFYKDHLYLNYSSEYGEANFKLKKVDVTPAKIRFFSEEASKSIWIAMYSDLYHIDTENKLEKQFRAKNNILSLHKDEDYLWVGTHQSGGVVLKKEEDTLIPVFNFLEDLSISHIVRDSDKGYWVTTLEAGVFYAVGVNNLVYTKAHGIAENYVTYVSGNGEGEIISGYRENQVSIIEDGKHKRNLTLDDENRTLVYPIKYEKSKQYYLIASHRQYVLKDGEVRILPSSPGQLKLIDNENILRCQREMFFSKDTVLVQQIHNAENFPHCKCMNITRDKELLIGNVKGLYSWKGGEVVNLGEKNKLFSYRIIGIELHPDFEFIAGTRGGGVVFSQDGEVFNLSVNDGLVSNQIVQVYVDKEYNIWVATTEGVSVINRNLKITNFTTKHGLSTNEVTSIYVDRNAIWIGTKNGLNRLNKKIFEVSHRTYPVIIKSIETGKEQLTSSKVKTIQLPYNESYLKLKVSALNYRSQGKVNYRYRLLGLSDDWLETDNNTLQFSSIPPGKYTLQIQAANVNGVWSDQPTELKIEVAFPFWQKWWFYAALIGVTFMVVSAIYLLRLNREKERNRMQQQISQYRQQALSAQMNPHFIFNSLNSIQSFITKNDRKQSNRFLAKFAKLMRINLANSQQMEVSVAEEMTALELYLELESIRFETLDFSIEIDPEIERNIVLVPTLLIQPFVENAIWHGLLHKDGERKLMIELKREDNVIHCYIEDNGIGRKVASALRTDESHQSFSTTITNKRLALLSSESNNEYSLKIEDLENENGEPTGTRVHFSVPHKKVKPTDT